MFGEQFYPTPDSLIMEMLFKVDFSNISSILEPSVGKGNIIDYVRKFKSMNRFKFYGFEIDLNLRKIVSDKCTLLGFDFLDFSENLLNFDLIVMNPPFKNGAAHLLKAWEIMRDGQIVCILNAETLRNTFSKERKILSEIIEQNGSVEFVSSAFEDAERKTSVEVAIVYLKKETKVFENIFQGFQSDIESDFSSITGEIGGSEILKEDKIESLLIYNRIIKKQIIEAEKQKARLAYYINSFDGIKKNIDISEKIEQQVLQINTCCWNKFFEVNNTLRGKVTSKVYEDFVHVYSSSKMDFTQKNIDFVVGAIMGSLNDIFAQNIIEIFDIFTKYHEENRVHIEGWKTNEAWQIGKKVVLPYYVDDSWGSDNTVRIKYNKGRELEDIETVFATLSGEKVDYSKSATTLDNKNLNTGVWYECQFFSIKFFKKGTAHFQFHDMELIKKFNYEVCKSKKWLHN